MEKMRCPICKGTKKVAKLGGMIGECNLCEGVGQIDKCDRPAVFKASEVIEKNVSEIKQAVADSVVASEIEDASVDPVGLAPKMFVTKTTMPKASYKKKRG